MQLLLLEIEHHLLRRHLEPLRLLRLLARRLQLARHLVQARPERLHLFHKLGRRERARLGRPARARVGASIGERLALLLQRDALLGELALQRRGRLRTRRQLEREALGPIGERAHRLLLERFCHRRRGHLDLELRARHRALRHCQPHLVPVGRHHGQLVPGQRALGQRKDERIPGRRGGWQFDLELRARGRALGHREGHLLARRCRHGELRARRSALGHRQDEHLGRGRGHLHLERLARLDALGHSKRNLLPARRGHSELRARRHALRHHQHHLLDLGRQLDLERLACRRALGHRERHLLPARRGHGELRARRRPLGHLERDPVALLGLAWKRRGRLRADDAHSVRGRLGHERLRERLGRRDRDRHTLGLGLGLAREHLSRGDGLSRGHPDPKRGQRQATRGQRARRDGLLAIRRARLLLDLGRSRRVMPAQLRVELGRFEAKCRQLSLLQLPLGLGECGRFARHLTQLRLGLAQPRVRNLELAHRRHDLGLCLHIVHRPKVEFELESGHVDVVRIGGRRDRRRDGRGVRDRRAAARGRAGWGQRHGRRAELAHLGLKRLVGRDVALDARAQLVDVGSELLVLGDQLLLLGLELRVLAHELVAQLLGLLPRALQLRLLIADRLLLGLVLHREPLAQPEHDAVEHLAQSVQHAWQLALARHVTEHEELLLEHGDALLHARARLLVDSLTPRLDRLESLLHRVELLLD